MHLTSVTFFVSQKSQVFILKVTVSSNQAERMFCLLRDILSPKVTKS